MPKEKKPESGDMAEPTLEAALKRIGSLELQMADALKRIESLEIQVAEMRGIKVASQGKRKPVNLAAFEKAVAAFGDGDRKAIREYLKYYRMPGER